jgi:hypothetical protein
MGPRRLWLTAVLAVGIAAGVFTALFQGGRDARDAKAGFAPALNAPSGSAAASSSSAARSARRTDDIPVTAFTAPAPAVVDADVRTLPAVPANPMPVRLEVESSPATNKPSGSRLVPPSAPTPAAPNVIPAPSQNFSGLSFTDVGAGFPPDTVGDVGPNHYIEAVNTGIRIFNKSGGTLATFTFNQLWSGAGSGTACDTNNNGDPTVVYDPIGNRWFVADFAWTPAALDTGPYYECIAVSQTADPVAGGWFLYAIRADDNASPYLTDYPKMGIWPDALYMSVNMFDCQSNCSLSPYQGVRAYAFRRTDLEAGLPVAVRVANVGTSEFTLLPGNLRGAQPPAGRDEFFAGVSGTVFAWAVYKFHADFVGAGSTFTGPTNVNQTTYPCCSFPNVITPVAANTLDSLADRAMMQLQYRNIGGTESLWITHTIATANNTLPLLTQWVQINVSGGNANTTPVQQQIWNPADGMSRWMAALAVDRQGNMGLGYTAANATTNPQVRYTGRLVGDPLGTLPQGEGTFVAGGGTQSNVCGGAACHRWGDYSAMSVDPIDDCTFWYVGEYYAASGSNWNTRIGAFKFPGCSPPTAAVVTRFASTRSRRAVVVTWRTGTEARVVGFNLFRNGVKVNRVLIAAKRPGGTGGAAYHFVDRHAPRVAAYRLQVVDLKGKGSWYGVGSAAPRK